MAAQYAEFFSKFKMDIDIEELTNAYNGVNEDIRKIAAQRGARLCDICIDDDAEHNGAMLSNFLSLDEAMSLGWENRTAAYDNALWSKRVTLFNTKSTDFLKYVKQITHPSKAMLSEYGWVYLINDSSDFMDYCYGQMIWGEERRKKATDTLVQRHSNLASQGIKYLKFIVPEKVIIYPQYLPRIFEGHEITENRPAVNLAAGCKEFISYPATLLKDACSYGHVYFRGDSHANWLGAFFLYHHIVEKLNNSLEATGHCQLMPHGLSDFDASLAAYAGDIFIQIDKEMRATFDGAWLPLNLSDDSIDKIEYLVRYTLSSSKRKAQKRPVEGDYLALLGDRETFRYSHPNKQLPRAVIFRDSTADYLVEPLAEHFSESLFIWHKGHVLSDVIEREKPDVVLHIMAERFVVQYDKFPIMATIGI